MPYYSAGDYYSGGDYYRGDFLGLGKAFKSVTKLVSGLGIPIVSQAAGIANSIAGGKNIIKSITGAALPGQTVLPMIAPPGGGGGMMTPEPGIAGVVHRIAPGGQTGYGRYTKAGEWTNRRAPRMQVTNTRALKRAGRRVRGFLKIASRLGALPINRSGKGKLFKRKRAR